MRFPFIRAMLFSLVLTGVGLAAGCNTMEGAGEDVEATGEAVEEAADND